LPPFKNPYLTFYNVKNKKAPRCFTEPFIINEIIKSLISLIETDAIKDDKNVNLELEEIPDINLEENDIKQLILNLTRNGLEAVDRGGYLTIKTFTDGEGVVLAVKDQGKGIQPEHMDKLCVPFFYQRLRHRSGPGGLL